MADWKLSPGDWRHLDVVSGDPPRARSFYADVFGWTFEDYPGGVGYVGVKTSKNGIRSGIGGEVAHLRDPDGNLIGLWHD